MSLSGRMQRHGVHCHHRRLQRLIQLGHAQVIGRLQVQPRLRIAAKEAAQAQGCIGRDAAPLQHDVIDARGPHMQLPGQGVGAHVHGLEIVLAQHLARVDGAHAIFEHCFLLAIGHRLGGKPFIPTSVVIHDLHVATPLSLQTKHTRHWSLMRMLCWPWRSPLSSSSRLPGGLRKKSRVAAASSWASLRSATLWMLAKRRLLPLVNKRCVSWHLKERIAMGWRRFYSAYRYSVCGLCGSQWNVYEQATHIIF